MRSTPTVKLTLRTVKVLRDPGAVALQHDTLEHLDALLLALDDPVVDAHRIADPEIGDPLAEQGSFDLREDVRGLHGRSI